jgi:hypothetical protein
MKTIQLFKENKMIMATDGIMHVDGRLNLNSIINEVNKRNLNFAKNFPHKIADSFSIYTNRIGGTMSNIINL